MHEIIERFKKDRLKEKISYLSIIIGNPILILLFKVYQRYIVSHLNPRCVLYYEFGLYCPGCGGTRSLQYLLSGDVVKSFICFPVTVYYVLYCLLYLLTNTYYYCFGNGYRLSLRMSHINIGIVILFSNFIIKNILVLMYDIRLF